MVDYRYTMKPRWFIAVLYINTAYLFFLIGLNSPHIPVWASWLWVIFAVTMLVAAIAQIFLRLVRHRDQEPGV